MQHSGSLLGWLIVGFAAGLVLFVRGLLLYRKSLLVGDTPVTTVRGAAMGLVQIHGCAGSDFKLAGPVSGMPCCAYKVKIERWVEGNRGGWRRLRTDASLEPFYLEDSTGRIRVEPDGAEFEAPESGRREVSASDGISASAAALAELSTAAIGSPVRALAPGTDEYLLVLAGGVGGNSSDRFRFTEYCVFPGKQYDVLGTCQEDARSQAPSGGAFIGKGARETTYVIASGNSKQLENRFQSMSNLMVWGGATLAVACAATWIARFR